MSFLTSIARGPSCRRLAFWVTLALALHTAGDTSVLADPPPTSANRFLFIVDVSAAMKPLDDGLRQSMFDLV